MSAGNPYEASALPQANLPTSRTFTITRIDVVSTGLLMAVLYALLAMIPGGLLTLFALLGIAAGGNMLGGLLTGVGAVLVFPVMYGMGGFLFGCVGALAYNVTAGLVGGIKFDLE